MTDPDVEPEWCRHCDRPIHQDACGCWTHRAGWRCADADTLAEPAALEHAGVPTAGHPPRRRRRL